MYIWVGADVDKQLGEIKELTKKTENALRIAQSTLTLPLHISLKISFCVDDMIADEVIDFVSEIFHTTLFMCEDKEQSGAAYEAVRNAPLPKKLRIDRLVIGTSPDGAVGTYQVIKTV